MKNYSKGIIGVAATFGIGIALFAAVGAAPARADGDDWRNRDRYDHARYEPSRDHDRLERIRFEEARERRIEQERRERARIERERRERWEREHDRWNRDHHDRDQIGFDIHFGHETHGDRG